MNHTSLFLKVAHTYPEFSEALDIVTKNSDGRICLIGGFVYRSIIQELYGIPVSKDVGLDFIVEKPKSITVPEGWKLEENRYGNPKLVGPIYEIDYVPLQNIYSLTRRNLEPTIQNFLMGTPLNVRSIAYDVLERKVIGDIGVSAIETKQIAVNDSEQARYWAERKGEKVDDLVGEMARQLGFSVLQPIG